MGEPLSDQDMKGSVPDFGELENMNLKNGDRRTRHEDHSSSILKDVEELKHYMVVSSQILV